MASGGETPTALDPETSALRKSWLQLCQLIENDACDDKPIGLPHATGQPQLIAELVEPLNAVIAPIERRRKPRRSRWLVAALAASLLVAVGVIAALKIFDDLNGARRGNPALIAHDRNPSSDQTAHGTTPSLKKTPVAMPEQELAAIDHLQWGDSVDDEITAVGRATALVRQDWYVQSGGIGAVETGINALERELDQGPL